MNTRRAASLRVSFCVSAMVLTGFLAKSLYHAVVSICKKKVSNPVQQNFRDAQPTIVKMVDTGLIGGTGTGAKDENNRPADLDLSMDMIRVFVTNDRARLYNKP